MSNDQKQILGENEAGLVCAYAIDGTGRATKLVDPKPSIRTPGADWRWLHFFAESPKTKDWLTKSGWINSNVVDALTSIGTRPRFHKAKDGFLLILRGVNLNPGADPEDMVSIRLWLSNDNVITTRRELVLAIKAMREAYEAGNGHANPGAFLIALTNGLVERMSLVIDALEEEIEKLETLAGQSEDAVERRGRILKVRSRSIMLRRYLAPQRDALSDMLAANVEIFDEMQIGSMRLVADRISRYVEDLDAVRDRAAAVQEEISTQLSEQMNTTMYRLSIVATIFLPLSLLTGLFGINVGGMPGIEDKSAFWMVTLSLFLLGVAGYWLLKRFKMI